MKKNKFFKALLVIAILMMLITFLYASEDNKEGKWEGVDAKVVEKYAKLYGREPRDPIINTDQGDLILFIFTLAGAVGGFVIGYNYRTLFGREQKSDNSARA